MEFLYFINSKVKSSFDLCTFTELQDLKELEIDLSLAKKDEKDGMGTLDPCQCVKLPLCDEVCEAVDMERASTACADGASGCNLCSSTLPNLQTVAVTHTSLRSLSKDIFSSLEASSVTTLILRHNDLTSFHAREKMHSLFKNLHISRFPRICKIVSLFFSLYCSKTLSSL